MISQLIRIHILFHIQMGLSVEITPHGDPGGGATLICSSYVGSGPASTVHPNKYQELQAPQKIFFIPPKNIHFSETPQKILKFKILSPKNGPSLRMYENIRVPPPSPLDGDAH